MVRIRVLGQSFFYNQIRQIVGAALSVATGAVSSCEILTCALELPLRLAPRHYEQYQQALFVTAPAAGLLLVDSGFDRHPAMAVATTAANAQRLADPPKFVLLGAEAEAENDQWRAELHRRIVAKWVVNSPTTSTTVAKEEYEEKCEEEEGRTCLADRFAAQLSSFSATAAMEADLRALWEDWRDETGAAVAEAERMADESQRRAAVASGGAEDPDGKGFLGRRRYRSMLPKGIATALAAHCRLPPGRMVADVQRGLCETMMATAAMTTAAAEAAEGVAGASTTSATSATSATTTSAATPLPGDILLSPTATTEEILKHVDIVGVEELARRGQEHRR